MFFNIFDILKNLFCLTGSYSNDVFPEPLSPEEEDKCIKGKMNGNMDDRNKLIEHNFSVRALNCFKANNLESMYDLIKCSREDLLSFRQFGKKSLTEIEDYLESINLHLGTDFSVIEEILAKHW